jgi:hypothetical protein
MYAWRKPERLQPGAAAAEAAIAMRDNLNAAVAAISV